MIGFDIPELFLLVAIFIVGFFGILGALAAGRKNRSILGWFVLCAVCPLCLIIIALLETPNRIEGIFRQCPACKKFVRWETRVCKHCRTPITPVPD